MRPKIHWAVLRVNPGRTECGRRGASRPGDWFSSSGVVALMTIVALLVLLAPRLAPAKSPKARLKPLLKFSFTAAEVDLGVGAGIAFDNQYAYISSPDGTVFRTKSLTPRSQLKQIFRANAPNARDVDTYVYVYDGVLYVLANPNPVVAGPSPNHVIFKSGDQGRSFTPIDRGLIECHGIGSCFYLATTQLFARHGLIYTNSGGGFNFLVSNDDGVTWIALSGLVEGQICYLSNFDIAGNTVFQGGECTLDHAFLKRGTLRSDGLGWIPGGELEPVQSPNLGNRKVNAVMKRQGSGLVLAGPEGALLRSVDDGRSFKYVFEYDTGAAKYPYTKCILFPSKYPTVALIGGFNKGAVKQGKPYLAYGTAPGKHWAEIQIPGVQEGTVTALVEDHSGRIIAAITDIGHKRVVIAEVLLHPSPDSPR